MSGIDLVATPSPQVDTTRTRRHAAKRRADAQPYEPRRPRRSQRLGGARGQDDNGDDDGDDDDQLTSANANNNTSRSTSTNSAGGGGLFSRLFSFMGKFVAEEPKQDDENDVDEEEQDETMSPERSAVDEEDATDASNATGTPSVDVATVSAPAQNGHAEITRSPPSKRASPVKHKQPQQQRTSVFGGANGTANTTKTLKIGQSTTALDADGNANASGFAFGRLTGRRRNQPSSPSNKSTESPIAVIKKKKPISFEEYERLSGQLRSLVETTPENALALTRSALTTALEARGPSENDRDRRELSVAALPSAKRARPSDELPITLPRDVHRGAALRKPKPSRLLTGAKRDAASRSAYSAAVAEKILTTLNKLQSPLDKESQKPTPSTSLSWAKYHLALTSQDDSGARARETTESMDTDEKEDFPPTTSIPKVAWKPVEQPAKTQTTVSSSFTFPQPGATLAASKPIQAVASSPAFSSRGSPVAPEQSTSTGQFEFTLPAPSAPRSFGDRSDDESIQYFFTPPPALRDPPTRAPGQKAVGSSSSTAPFSFMPASPKMRPESLTKSVPAKVKAPVVSIPAAPTKPVSSVPPPAGTNPLTRFLQTEEGSWKCPSCAVANGPTVAKCPCCETSKPAEALAIPPPVAGATRPISSISSGPNPLTRFMEMDAGSWKCPTCAVTNGEKFAKCPCCNTDKPGDSAAVEKTTAPSAGSISSNGFSFGVKAMETKKTESTPPAVGGFSFGAPPTTEKPKSPVSSSAGFSFGVSSSTTTEKAVAATPSGFSFNAPVAAKPAAELSPKPTTGFSFGVASAASSLQKRKASDEALNESSEKKAATAAVAPAKASGGFSFGSSAASASPPAATGFSFGASTKAADATSESAAKKPAFAFGSGETTSPAQESSLPSFLSSGAGPKSAAAEKKSDSAGFGATFGSSAPSSDAKSSFSFGSTTPAQPQAKPAEAAKPSFSFGASAAEPKSAAATPPKPAFSFGSTPAGKPESAKEAKPAFTFGGSSSAASGFGSTTGTPATAAPSAVNKPSFSFGASSTTAAVANTTATPAFAFGGGSTDASAKKAEGAAAFTFDGSSSQAPATSFGAAATTFGTDMPSSGSFGQSTSFGGATATSTGFGASSSGFGAPTTATSSGFGSAAMTSTGFGATTSTSSGFGAPMSSSGFGATSSGFASTMTSSGFGSAPTSTAFGSTPATTPSFGNTPGSTPSGAAFPFGASTPATSQPAFSFGASTSSSAFNTPTTDVFGSSHTTGFGSASSAGTTFGSNAPSSGFGAAPAPAFGATPTPSPAFGAPAGGGSGFGASNAFGAPSSGSAFGMSTPAPSPAFGGAPSSAFGTPSNAFGAPTSGFGSAQSGSAFGSAPPTPSFGAPAAAGFGAPAPGFGGGAQFGGAPPGDGFSMGAAPQNPKGRRILKARSKRT